jgi:RHS repeat-associated protein
MRMNRICVFLSVLLWTLLAAEDAFAFYNPSTGRWLSRDPAPDMALRNLDHAQSRSSLENNLYLFVRNVPLSFIDPFGLYSFGESCKTSQRNKINAAIAANCSKAKQCCSLSSLGAFSEVVDLLCNHRNDPNPVVDCPDVDTPLPTGGKCDACAKGDTPGNRIWVCPQSFDPEKQNPFGCRLGCVIFHEANHNRGLKHGTDMNGFDKCMGCPRE